MEAVIRDPATAPRIPFAGQHRVARPLPEPPRSRHVAKCGMPATDELGKRMEEWLSDVRIAYTEPAD